MSMLFHDFPLSGDVEVAKERVLEEFNGITEALQESLQMRLGPPVQEESFAAIAVFLDTKFYQHTGTEMILSKLDIIVKKFQPLLEANNCNL